MISADLKPKMALWVVIGSIGFQATGTAIGTISTFFHRTGYSQYQTSSTAMGDSCCKHSHGGWLTKNSSSVVSLSAAVFLKIVSTMQAIILVINSS